MDKENIKQEENLEKADEVTGEDKVDSKETKVEETVDVDGKNIVNEDAGKTDSDKSDESVETKESDDKGTDAKKVEEVEKEHKVEVDKLLEDISDKDEQINKLTETVNDFNDLKEKHNATIETLQAYESILADIAESKIKNVPEDYHDLIPEGDVVKRLDWLNRAEEKGLFNSNSKANEPLGRKTRGNDKGERESEENLTAVQKIAGAFREHYGN